MSYFIPLIKGISTHLPGLYKFWNARRLMGNTFSAEYCLSIWLHHLTNYQNTLVNENALPENILEIGPGATLGCTLASLLSGSRSAIAIDDGHYIGDLIRNQEMLDLLVKAIGNNTFYSRTKKALEDLFHGVKDNPVLNYSSTWEELCVEKNSVDLIFSHSVMEHVKHPKDTYKNLYTYLKHGGIMSHRIDHSSHGITDSWNGHFKINDFAWKIIIGKRRFLLNRLTAQAHIEMMRQAGFKILDQTSFTIQTIDGAFIKTHKLPDDPFLAKSSSIIATKT